MLESGYHFLGVAEGLENIEKQDHQAVTFFYPWFNNRSVFFYNMYVDVSEWSIQNAGTVVCVCMCLGVFNLWSLSNSATFSNLVDSSVTIH